MKLLYQTYILLGCLCISNFIHTAQQQLKYNLVNGLPDIYLSTESEKIGCTWRQGDVWDKPLIELFFHYYQLKKRLSC